VDDEVVTPPTTKEGQRAELHKTIWRLANELRGSVDGWDFKSYVLGVLFYRFISENLAAYLNALERQAGDADFDYTKLKDSDAEFGRKDTVEEKGFYILPSELFANVRERADKDEDLNETLETIFKNIEGSASGTDSEGDLKGLFDDLDVNSAKLGNTVAKRNEKLVKLLNAIGDLNLGSFSDHTIDAFGDAYEYLMTMYASTAGKSGGEFFTPQEVSELLAHITVVGKTSVNKVYDPAVGSGSLLLKFAKVLGKENVRQGFFGQEINLTTYNLARINMFLHDINYEQFSIEHGDTLLEPAHWDDEPFEAIVSNPPYSIKWPGNSDPLLINDLRFAPAGVLAPKNYADLAFTMHMLSWLAVNGTAAIVQFPGAMYRGGSEQKIRKYLVDNNYVDCVIQLPPDLFFGTPIATCILVLKKSKKDNAVLFIDASGESKRVGNKNKLLPGHQKKILDAFISRSDATHFATLVSAADIAANGYSLSVPAYVEEKDTTQAVDIADLNADIARLVGRQQELREQIDAIVADLENGS
jgi:type I restriction enzyme M protein